MKYYKLNDRDKTARVVNIEGGKSVLHSTNENYPIVSQKLLRRLFRTFRNKAESMTPEEFHAAVLDSPKGAAKALVFLGYTEPTDEDAG